jgi:hypothetical protein
LVLVGYFALVRPGPISGDLNLVRSNRPGLRVLFIGNSFTARNSMIRMLAKLADGDPGALPIFPVEYTPGGSTLLKATHDGQLRKLFLNEHWDDVVLQEQSQIPSRPGVREAWMFPAATWFDRVVRNVGSHTILFLTWGYKNGDRDARPGDTYAAMQARLDEGYFELSSRLHASLSPVGIAWAEAAARRPGINLWAGDGRHPTRAGSYLAACVFYALLSHRDPVGNPYRAGLAASDAGSLQDIARWSVRRLYAYPA